VEQYICVHGHFYQPSRENPWLEAIQVQDSAYPYHDWSERITAECYAPNATARILDGTNRIVKIANNYAKISFDFGPTLLAWLEKAEPEVYAAILAADRESQKTFAGHGSALAQAYNHLILPLANRRDKYTQVLWGIRDFQHRFGRMPEGMWLPETAVDLETLDILAELGIRFTILAPHQARQTRRLGGRTRVWRDHSSGGIDPSMAYELSLASGRKITLFFFDGPISRAIAFEGLLTNGEQFAHRLLSAFLKTRPWSQLIHIATDGESYGHHHRFGDMALAFALHAIETGRLARLTNYGEYLEKHPPTCEVEIFENTSWSCIHGVERWRNDCGCNAGSGAVSRHPDWTQAWRAPLRTAFDWLRDALADRFEEKGGRLLNDPWAARNDYIAVLLERSPENTERFLGRHAARALNDAEKRSVLKLMEMQRHAMLMYTSCGWFFDDLSGVETVQVLEHAGRALQLAEQVFEVPFEPRFLDLLGVARSNLPKYRDGRHLYEQVVKPAVVDWEKVGAHHAMSFLFATPPLPSFARGGQEGSGAAGIPGYLIQGKVQETLAVGKAKLVVGRARITALMTQESAVVNFGFLHLGDHNLFGGVRKSHEEQSFRDWLPEVTRTFTGADFPATIHCLEEHFGTLKYSLKSLFPDEQRQILNHISRSTLAEVEAVYRQLYENHTPLLRFLADLGVPLTALNVSLPKALQPAAEFILNLDLRRACENEQTDLKDIGSLLKEALRWQVTLDTACLGYVLTRRIERQVERFRAQPEKLSLLKGLKEVLELARSLSLELDLCKAQNTYYEMLQSVFLVFRTRAEQGDERAQTWVAHFAALGQPLRVRTPGLRLPDPTAQGTTR
jgi:alpha-amylase/alpha-mannosidase (GH57 family)